jgi:hypothetical protein
MKAMTTDKVKTANETVGATPTGTLSLEDEIMSLRPVAYLKLDDRDKSNGAQARDSSGNGRHGVYHGGCSATGGPVKGSTATLFNGTDGYVEIPDNDVFSIPTSGQGLTVLRIVRPEVMRFPPNRDSNAVAGTIVQGPYRLPAATTIHVSDVTGLAPSGFITVIADDSSVVQINYTGTTGVLNGTLTGCSAPHGAGKTLSTGAAFLQNDAFVYIDGKGADHEHEWGCRFYSDTDANPGGPRPNEISFYTWSLSGGEGSGAHDKGPFAKGVYRMIVGAADAGDWHVPYAGNRIWTDGGVPLQAPPDSGTLYSNPKFHVTPGNGYQPVRIGTRTKAAYFGGAVGHWAVFGRVLENAEVSRLFLAWTSMSPAHR